MTTSVRLAWRDLRAHKVMTTLVIILLTVSIGLATLFLAFQSTSSLSQSLKSDGLQARMYLDMDRPIAQTPQASSSGPRSIDARDEENSDYANTSVLDTVNKIVAPNVATFEFSTAIVPHLSSTPSDKYYLYYDGVLTPRSDATLVAGRLPQAVADPDSPQEIAIDHKAMVATGASIGSILYAPIYGITGTQTFAEYKVVGEIVQGITLDNPNQQESNITFDQLYHDRSFDTIVVQGDAPVTWDQVKSLNAYGLFVESSYVIDNPPPESELYPADVISEPASSWSYRIAISALTFVGILEVIFIISPAFTIAAKRNERMLAQLAAIGAAPKTLAGIMLWEGVIVGVLGGIGGLLSAFVISAITNKVLHLGITINVMYSILIFAITVILGVLATIIPAVVAARVNVVKVLAARNDFRKVRIHYGIIPFIVGIASAIATLLLLRNYLMNDIVPITIGVGLVALAASAPVFVTLVAKIFDKTPASRLAARNLTRNMNRTGSAVAAITLASVGGMLAGITGITQYVDGLNQHVAYAETGGARVELTAQFAGGEPSAIYDLTLSKIDAIRSIAHDQPIYMAEFGEDRYVCGNRQYIGDPRPSEWSSDYMSTPLSVYVASSQDVASLNFLNEEDRGLASEVLAAGGVLLAHGDESTQLRLLEQSADKESESVVTRMNLYDAKPGEIDTTSKTNHDAVPVARMLPNSGSIKYVLSPDAVKRLEGRITVAGAALTFTEPIRWSDRDPVYAISDAIDGLAVVTIAAPDLRATVMLLGSVLIAVLLMIFISGILVIMISRASRADMDIVEAIGAPPGFRRKFTIATAVITMVSGLLPGTIVAYYGVWLAKRYLGFISLGYHPEIALGLSAILVIAAIITGALFPPKAHLLTRRQD